MELGDQLSKILYFEPNNWTYGESMGTIKKKRIKKMAKHKRRKRRRADRHKKK